MSTSRETLCITRDNNVPTYSRLSFLYLNFVCHQFNFSNFGRLLITTAVSV